MNKLNLISSALLLSTLGFNTVAQANTFQKEAAVAYANTDYLDVLIAGFTYHFSEQATNKGPWAEAGFLNKSSFASAAITYADADYWGSETGFSLMGQGMINDTFFINADYSKIDDFKSIGIGAGAYLTDTSAVYFNYNNIDNSAFNDDSDYEFTLGYKNIVQLNNNNSVAFTAQASKYEGEEQTYGLNADYYFTPKTYLGLGLTYIDYNEYGSHTNFELSAGHFFNNQVGVDVSYMNGDLDDTTTISAVFRF
ncbi:MAG: putative porin [Thalassotalea sp.]